jgi:mono/diheme cytochrome c family protein
MKKIIVSLALGGALIGAAFTAGAQQAQQQSPAQQHAPTASTPPAQAAPAPSGGGGAFGSNAAAANPFPDHPGREIVSVACTQCHGPNVFTQLRMGDKAWRAQIYDMILRGAQINPDDIDKAVQYMVASYGPGVPFPGQQPAKVSLADGSAKSLVEGGCALCHGLDRVVAAKRTKEQWQTIVNRMIFFGAPITGDQVGSVVDYLSTNYGAPQTASAK